MRQATTPHLRWMIRRDLLEVVCIEETCFEYPGSEEDFINFLRQKNTVGLVAEQDGCVVGFIIYETHPQALHILNVAVHPGKQRLGFGRVLIEKLIHKLTAQGRKAIQVEVRETNLLAQVFLRHMGFRATRVIRNYYEDSTDDAYVMRYDVAIRSPYVPINRIAWCPTGPKWR